MSKNRNGISKQSSNIKKEKFDLEQKLKTANARVKVLEKELETARQLKMTAIKSREAKADKENTEKARSKN